MKWMTRSAPRSRCVGPSACVENTADFPLTQQITCGLAIVEIKTIRSPPLDARPFRGDLFGPHELLCAAMARAFGTANAVGYDLRSGAYRSWRCQRERRACSQPCDRWLHSGDRQSERSLDLFRSAPSDPAIVTFYEIRSWMDSRYPDANTIRTEYRTVLVAYC